MKSTRSYDFTLTANGAFVLPVSGSFFRILTSTGQLEVQGDTFGRVPVYAGQGLRNQDFTKLTLIDKTGAANIGTILVSDGEFIDDRITGSVTVIDSAYQLTLTGQSWAGSVNFTATAGNFPHAQIKNPTGSGKNVVVTSLSMTSVAAAGAGIGFLSADLTTAVGGVTAKLSTGAAALSALLKSQSNAASLIANYIWTANLSANSLVAVPFAKPIVLKPGDGVAVVMTSVADGMQVNFEGEEYSIT